MSKRNTQLSERRLRIIAGRWRGRRLSFPAIPGLRPTPERVRETLFNWLQPVIHEARCLDLFAGSGMLGLEALSRGATSVVMVDHDRQVVAALVAHTIELGMRGIRIVCADAMNWLQSEAEQFDIVFLDPPFGKGLLVPFSRRLQEGGWLVPGAYVYMEAEHELGIPELPAGWRLLRTQRAGQVGYHLLCAE